MIQTLGVESTDGFTHLPPNRIACNRLMLQHSNSPWNPPDKNRGLISKSSNALRNRSHWFRNRKIELEKLSKNPELAKRARPFEPGKDISSLGEASDKPPPIVVTKYDILSVTMQKPGTTASAGSYWHETRSPMIRYKPTRPKGFEFFVAQKSHFSGLHCLPTGFHWHSTMEKHLMLV